MEQQKPNVMSFGKYKRRDIRDVPLSYLRWRKSVLIDTLRVCGAEVRRREELGLTEDEELQLGILPPFVRENLLQRLEACRSDDDRASIHGMIQIKFQEYSRNANESDPWRRFTESEKREEMLDENDAG
jgi:Putative quorum-sensing-regulated virulence factor